MRPSEQQSTMLCEETAGCLAHSPAQKRRRFFFLALWLVVLGSVYPFLARSSHMGTPDDHGTIEWVGALFGIVAGLAMITRFYALGNRLHLFIGLAFLVNGTEDFVHGWLSLAGEHNWLDAHGALCEFIPGTYVAGRMLFGLLLVLAPFAPKLLGAPRSRKRETVLVSIIVLLATMATTALAFKLPLPQFIYPDQFIARPVDLISAAVLLAAMIVFIREYHLSGDALCWWVLLSAGVNTIGQMMMSFSSRLFDPMFAIAHVYKVIGYVVPLLGFCLYQISVISAHRRAEEELRKHREHLEELVAARTTEMNEANEKLKQENAERKAAEEAARRSEEYLRITLGSIGDGVISVDASQRVTSLNTIAEQLTGWPFDEAEGKKLGEVFRIINEETGAPAHDPVARVLESGRIEGLANHTVLIARDGTRRAIADSAAPIRDSAGLTVGVVLVFRDVSVERQRQKERERLLSELRQRVKELDCLYGLSKIIEEPGIALDEIFQAAAELLPVAWQYPGITIGRIRWGDQVFQTDDTLEGMFCQSSDILVHGQKVGAVEVYYRESRPEADEGPFVVGQRALIDALARQLGGTIERHQAREQLQKAKADAEAANKAKSEFLANMSHEIRTPLTSILGFAEMLSDPDGSCEDRAEWLQAVQRNGKHLLTVIDDVLDLSKIEAGELSLRPRRCNVAALISDVVSMMRVRAQQQGISLRAEYDGEMPGTILADEARLRQVLVNLVGNAIKFTESGGVTMITTFLPHWRGSAPAVRVQVIDTGTGISPEHLKHLCDPFYQEDTSATRKRGGTGLGLAITQRIINLMGGELDVDSMLGKGSVFTVTIPAGPLDGIEMLKDPTEAVRGSGERTESIPLRNKALAGAQILLAEDGPDNQRLISTILRSAGAEVQLAENGRQAVEQGLSKRFDLVLMDMQMPEMDGYQATKELREKGFSGPIVALTADAMSEDRERSLAAGCAGYLSKPLDRSRLIRTIARYIAPGSPDAQDDSPAPGDQVDGTIGSQFADDPALAGILTEFVDSLGEKIEALREALAAGSWPELETLAHQLKGAGGSYGYPVLTDAAADLEAQAKARDTEAANLALSKLAVLCQAIASGRKEAEHAGGDG